MTAETIRRHITAVPFKPFTLHTADGRSVHVHARDFIIVSPLGQTVDVYQANDDQDILDVSLITSVSFPGSPQTTSQPQQSSP